MSASATDLIVPTVDWDVIHARVNEYWDAREAPHHSIMGQTRSGKSYLVRHGILPLARWDRVLILDAKGFDTTLTGLGKPVIRLPTFMRGVKRLIREEKPGDNWYRLVFHDDWQAAQSQVHEALDRVWDEGDWIVVVDELRALTDVRPPGINLRSDWERLMLRGGSKGISVVNLTQEPRWVPGTFYNQFSFAWISKIEDEVAQKRLSEIGSSKALLPHVQTIPRRQWLYMDSMEDTRYWARTAVGKRWNQLPNHDSLSYLSGGR